VVYDALAFWAPPEIIRVASSPNENTMEIMEIMYVYEQKTSFPDADEVELQFLP
jgi:hypothetical protein